MLDLEQDRLARTAKIGGIQTLFLLQAANMQITTDQPFSKVFGGTNYMVTHAFARQRTGGASVVCAGGIFDGAGKTGNIIVLAAQSWVTLASAVPVFVPIASLLTNALLSVTPILALATGSTAACTADLWIMGVDIT